ncbi:YggS family pyridoxal phosphate enzyme, partial [Klebsiella oxytoca]
MAIPAPENDYNKQVEVIEKMHKAFKQLQNQYPDIDTLSMGMTGDMEAAIACGSTLVRIGTAIFGARDYANK